MGKDFHGDPASALLEVLDPEQNSTFHDNFVEVEYDLSKVLFITTANTVATINPALRDRMEMIEVSGYSLEEKVEIAKRHLLPNQLKEHGLNSDALELSDKVLAKVIQEYTRESGVRNLNQKIAKLVRYAARMIASEQKYNPKLTNKDIEKILGVPRYTKELYQGNDIAGVVTGLAWTEVGGEILLWKPVLAAAKVSTLTGNLGEVMKESAILALEYIKSHADYLGIKHEVLRNGMYTSMYRREQRMGLRLVLRW